jgi:hypothetical protein
MVSVELPDPFGARVTLEALRDAVGPATGVEFVKEMLPVKPLRLCKVIVDDVESPGARVRLTGLAAREKSGPTVMGIVIL